MRLRDTWYTLDLITRYIKFSKTETPTFLRKVEMFDELLFVLGWQSYEYGARDKDELNRYMNFNYNQQLNNKH